MMEPQKQFYQNLSQKVIKGLEKRNFNGYYCETAEAAVEKAMAMLEDGASAAWGGSETLKQTGLIERLKQADNLQVIDRDAAQTPEEKRQIYFKCSAADYYFMSSNAITQDGELVNVDGMGNRVACLIYGPANIIILAGMNKIVPDVRSGIERVRYTAAPPNANRLGLKTPCASAGYCMDCHVPDCICSDIVITRRSKEKGRIKVILIGEDSGY